MICTSNLRDNASNLRDNVSNFLFAMWANGFTGSIRPQAYSISSQNGCGRQLLLGIPFLVLVFSPIFLASWLVFWRVEPTMLVARLASNTQELRANPVDTFLFYQYSLIMLPFATCIYVSSKILSFS